MGFEIKNSGSILHCFFQNKEFKILFAGGYKYIAEIMTTLEVCFLLRAMVLLTPNTAQSVGRIQLYSREITFVRVYHRCSYFSTERAKLYRRIKHVLHNIYREILSYFVRFTRQLRVKKGEQTVL